MDFSYTPIILSLKVAFAAVIIVTCVSIPLAGLMAKKDFLGKDVVESIITLPLVLPPSVIGFMLLVVFGKNGPIGKLLEHWFHTRIVFTLAGAVVAASVVSLPLMYQSVKVAMENVDQNLEKAARTLGAKELKIFFTITLPLAWNGILAGLVLAFARSLGEFGATLMIAGNIPGRTQTMPLAIYFANEAGDMRQASILVIIMTIFSFMVIYGLNRWGKGSHRVSQKGGRDHA
ncbi:molybdate ABC transporter, permease protein [Desulfosporosinus orientis DSM 765]|uniref:Molybdenum transport system permease n=1 Tax=Desulfosporosinus orientis (strain ATCC 19365 / DSM 765 / NCIMB 8382 / VKM B-1628 / Singapore I) TaxID=768706 RepID=G7W7N7_DESOD|nr:molybdate ABC transporter permease subunit [Desulfosporosinus orientis]AET66102.1 molybdate ABC transporter, permease protein [Desulfosporosinus orientis DSM 765]